MAHDAGNIALFFDLAGTLVAMDDTRQLPLQNGRIRVTLLPNVREKILPIRDHLFFVITNQAGIKRGRISMAQVEDAIADLDRQLGDILSAWQICPHDDADGCDCRKPKGGMITDLAELYGVDLAGSTLIGDQDVDEQAARAAGVGRFTNAKNFFGWE
ncbi:MAG: HAD-IIIA family hydrolase [Candidatus Binataceae bacterium]